MPGDPPIPARSGPSERPDLLVLRAIKLGDLLVAVPALRALRRAYPAHRIVLATTGWLGPLVDLVDAVDVHLPTPGLDEPLRVAPGTVDIAANLHGNGPESRGLLEAIRPRRRLGHAAPGWDGPEWIEGDNERARWARLVEWHGAPADPDDVSIRRPDAASPAPGAVVVHVGAFYGSRHWPVDRFARVVEGLRRDGHRVVVSGGEADVERAEAVAAASGTAPADVLAGRLPLDEFAALIADARGVVTVDTGAAHLASAYRTPSVVLFGPAPPEQWGPPATGPHIVLTDASVRRGDVFADDPDPALLAVTPDDVLGAFASL